jgi:hypothetical protein
MLSDVVGLRHPQYTVRSAPAPRAMRSHAHRTCHAACASSCVPHWCRPGVARCVWPGVCGPVCVAQCVWPGVCGPVCVARCVWPGVCGPVCVAQCVWPGVCGPVCVARCVWGDREQNKTT